MIARHAKLDGAEKSTVIIYVEYQLTFVVADILCFIIRFRLDAVGYVEPFQLRQKIAYFIVIRTQNGETVFSSRR